MQMESVVATAANATVATGAVTSVLWLPWLQSISDIAAWWLPVFGCVYLILRIGEWAIDKLKNRKSDKD